MCQSTPYTLRSPRSTPKCKPKGNVGYIPTARKGTRMTFEQSDGLLELCRNMSPNPLKKVWTIRRYGLTANMSNGYRKLRPRIFENSRPRKASIWELKNSNRRPSGHVPHAPCDRRGHTNARCTWGA